MKDLNFDGLLDDFNPDEYCWKELIQAALAGNVVPVIGPDIVCEPREGMNINQFIVAALSKKLGLKEIHKSFSQLVYDEDFLKTLNKHLNDDTLNKDVVYALVYNLFNNSKNMERYFKPSKYLKRLFETKLFPFVITTSFAPVVENVMSEVWGKRQVKVLKFSNNIHRDLIEGASDILSEEELHKPTVFYMFGKLSKVHKSYVLTDEDMLEFCSSWLSSLNRPNNLVAQLKDKYLLMLGCGYPDWLFRFILFSLYKTSDTEIKGLVSKELTMSETLLQYLRRIGMFVPDKMTVEDIVCEISRKTEEYDKTVKRESLSSASNAGAQVFISYSRAATKIAESLYRFLVDHGLSVWFDRYNLIDGSNLTKEIENAIENSKVFVPILSSDIAKESRNLYVYRKEWAKAVNLQQKKGNTFIIPLIEKGFDVDTACIPAEFKYCKSVSYDSDFDFMATLDSINEALNK